MKCNSLVLIAFAAAALLSATGAQATTLKIDRFAHGKHGAALTNFGSVDVGPMDATLDGNVHLTTYCVDLDHKVRFGDSYQVKALPIGQLHNGALAAQLFNTYRSQVVDRETGSALQLAIWKVLQDGADTQWPANFGHGRFRAMGDGVDLATEWLNSDSWKGASSDALWLEPLHHPHCEYNQGQIAAVPEPTSIAGIAIGVVALVSRRRRR